MAVFGNIRTDDCVAVNDKFRIDVTGTWKTQDEPELTLIEIEPYNGYGFIDVSNDGYLDWAYVTSGSKTISLRITNDNGTFFFLQEIEAKTEEMDCCLADDSCFEVYEVDIAKYLPCYRTSFKYVHRKVASSIIDCINRMGLGNPLIGKIDPKNPSSSCDRFLVTCDHLKGNETVRKWATFHALELIFSSLSSKVDDYFSDKSRLYCAMANDVKNSPNLYIDFNLDGEIDYSETVNWCKKLVLK